jgi:hypothetical protein
MGFRPWRAHVIRPADTAAPMAETPPPTNTSVHAMPALSRVSTAMLRTLHGLLAHLAGVALAVGIIVTLTMILAVFIRCCS